MRKRSRSRVSRTSVASSGSDVTLKDIETLEPLGGGRGGETQEKSIAFFDGLAKRLPPIHAGLDLLFVEPNEKAGFLQLADDITGDLQVGCRVADEDAPGSSVFFTMCFVHKIKVSRRRGTAHPPSYVELGDKVTWIGRDDANQLCQPTEVDDHAVAPRFPQILCDEKLGACEVRETFLLDHLDEESQDPVGKAETENEEVSVSDGFSEERKLMKLLVESQEEIEYVIVPHDKIAYALGTAKNLIDEWISQLVKGLR